MCYCERLKKHHNHTTHSWKQSTTVSQTTTYQITRLCRVKLGTNQVTDSRICQVKYRVRTDIKMLFFRTFQDLQRPNSRVFQDSKSFFPGHVPFRNMGWIKSKMCIYKISYQCISITVKKRKCNTWGCIIVFSSIKAFLTFGLTQEVAMY